MFSLITNLYYNGLIIISPCDLFSLYLCIFASTVAPIPALTRWCTASFRGDESADLTNFTER